MNKKEQLLKRNLEEYSKNISNYGYTLNHVLTSIDRLIELESNITDNLKVINNINSKVRSLEFIKQLSNLPEINKEILQKIKSYINE